MQIETREGRGSITGDGGPRPRPPSPAFRIRRRRFAPDDHASHPMGPWGGVTYPLPSPILAELGKCPTSELNRPSYAAAIMSADSRRREAM